MADTPPLWRPPATDQTTVYTNVTVVDGTDRPARQGAAILVTGQHITQVGPSAEVAAAAADATVVDCGGRYAIPGLIDTHQHLATPPDRPQAEAWLRRQIYGGVTTIRDMADDLRHVADLARATLIGETPGPDISYAALMAGPHFFSDERTWQVSRGLEPGNLPWMHAITPETDVPQAVSLARGTGARAIKIYADLDAQLVEAITRAAHDQGMCVWAHAAVFPATPLQVVSAGVDTVSHAQMWAYELAHEALLWYGGKPNTDHVLDNLDDPRLGRLIAEMLSRGVILDATVSMWSSVELASRPNLERDRAIATAMARLAHRAGIPISAGTDYETPFEDAFPSVHRELRLLVADVGMSPAEALRSATSIAARALGASDTIGTLEPGKLANFVILDHDPAADIAALAQIHETVKRGRRFPRADLFQPAPHDALAGRTRRGVQRSTPIVNALGGLTNPNALAALEAAAGLRPEAEGTVIDARAIRDAHRAGLTAVNVTLGHVGGPGDADPYALTLAEIDRYDGYLDEHGDDLTLIRTAQDLRRAHETGRIGIIYGFQNSQMFDDDLDRVHAMVDRGVRVAQLTYNPANKAGGGCMVADRGLTDWGKSLVARINAEHLMVDLSHSNERTCLDAIDASAQPISINHTGCRALADMPRNKTDQELRLVAESGGFVGIYFMPFLTDDGHPTAIDVANHVCHAVDVCGIDHVGVGTDGDCTGIDDLDAYGRALAAHVAQRQAAGIGAAGERADTTPFVVDLRGPRQFDDVADLLRLRGFTDSDISQVFGVNFIHYAEKVWA